MFGYGLANRIPYRVEPLGQAANFRQNDELLFPLNIDGESRATTWTNRAVTLLNRPLDVLGIIILAADNDEVLEPAGHEQFTIFQKAQIPGSEVRTLTAVRQIRA